MQILRDLGPLLVLASALGGCTGASATTDTSTSTSTDTGTDTDTDTDTPPNDDDPDCHTGGDDCDPSTGCPGGDCRAPCKIVEDFLVECGESPGADFFSICDEREFTAQDCVPDGECDDAVRACYHIDACRPVAEIGACVAAAVGSQICECSPGTNKLCEDVANSDCAAELPPDAGEQCLSDLHAVDSCFACWVATGRCWFGSGCQTQSAIDACLETAQASDVCACEDEQSTTSGGSTSGGGSGSSTG